MTEKTLIAVEELQAIVKSLEDLSISLQDKQLWDCLTKCEQVRAAIQKWIFKDEG